MIDNIKKFSLKVAVTIFFIVSFIGLYKNYTPETVSLRALGSAAVAYLISLFTAKTINNIIINKLAEEKAAQKAAEQKEKNKKQNILQETA